MKKSRLFTPGPTEVPPDVLSALAEPMFHHRTPRYKTLQQKIHKDLQNIFKTQNPVLTFTSSGTGAMEAALANAIPQGKKILVVRAGKFGERFGEICKTHRIEFIPIDVEWGNAVDPETIQKELDADADIGMVATTLCETSTGVLTNIQRIGGIVQNTGALLVVDGISAGGAVEFHADDWGVDLFISGSQKALMLPPGLAFLSVSSKARDRIFDSPQRSYYFNLQKALKSAAKDETPFTPSVSLMVGLGVALERMQQEGIENIWSRHQRLAVATRAGVKALGLELFANPPCDALTAVCVPEGADGKKIPKILEEEFGIKIAGGQAELAGKIFRISHMGYVDSVDVLAVLTALGMTLKKMGVDVIPEAGVRAAQEVFEKP